MEEKVIKIYGRGKNRDIFGNPYYAAVIITNKRRIIIPEQYTGDSSERGVLSWSINECLRKGIVVDNDVLYNYKKVHRDSDLEHPERWMVEGRGLPTIMMYDVVCDGAIRCPDLKLWNIKRF